MKLTQSERKKVNEMKMISEQISFFCEHLNRSSISEEVKARCLEHIATKKKELQNYGPKLNWYLLQSGK